MGKGKKKTDVGRKKKKVTIEPLAPKNKDGSAPMPYRVLSALREKYHAHLADAKISIAWQMSAVREDVDGMLPVGRVKLGSDLDRAYAAYDFVIIIPHETWNSAGFDEDIALARMDFLLCKCMPVKDKHGEHAVDEKDRLVWRVRKPLAMFSENTRRFGIWQDEAMATSLADYNDSKRPMLNGSHKEAAAGFNEPANKPAANGRSKKHDPANQAPWRSVTLEEMGMPVPLREILQVSGITTLGLLANFSADHGSLLTVKGMSESYVDLAEQEIKVFQAEHPELWEAAGTQKAAV